MKIFTEKEKELIAQWISDKRPIDWIAREIKCSRDTFRKYYPDYKGNRGGGGYRKDFTKAEGSPCPVCGNSIHYLRKYNVYCSRKCSNVDASNRNKETHQNHRGVIRSKMKMFHASYWTKSMREQKGVQVKSQWQSGVYDKMLETRKKFYSSKGEQELRARLNQILPQYKWTTGRVPDSPHNLQRDIFCEELKVIIEYDGIWHFVDIHGQLAQKQMKDKLLNEWARQHGWKMIRVKEERFLQNKQNCLTDILFSIFLCTEQQVNLY